MDAPALAAAVRSGQLDPVDGVQAFLAQIRQQNPAVNALVNHDEAAPLRDAAALRPRIAAGETLALAGVPVVVKDGVWVAGRRITQGSALFREFVPGRSALPVQRLQAAGAVVIGIGNMPEFGAKEVTENRLYGRTLNPRDLTRTPGGSSGGCAAALAADMAPLALGGDGGGSCRRPPAHVGVVGFKPTSGVVADPWGFPSTLPGIACTCPMGRTVADVIACFAALAGQHPADVLSIDPAPPTGRPATSLRVAFSPRLGLDCAVDQDGTDTVAAAVESLRQAGLRVAAADPPWPAGTSEEAILAIEEAGLAALYGERWLADPGLLDPHVGWQVERGLRRSGAEVAAAHAASLGIAATMAAFFADWDLLLCPTLACVAWPAAELNPDRIGGLPSRHRGHAVFTPLFNHARTPALTLPCGAGASGLPLGLQVIGPRLSDHAVLHAGAWMEQALGRAARPWLLA